MTVYDNAGRAKSVQNAPLTGSFVPGSYVTGGVVLDLTPSFSSVLFLGLQIEVEGALPPGRWVVIRNSPAPGKCQLKYMVTRFDRATAGNTSAQNPPAGVTLQSASGASTVAGSSHTHTITSPTGAEASHQHNASALTAQAVDAVSGVGTATRVSAASAAGSSHTHTITSPSGAEAAHTHVANNLYQHGHVVTQTQTDAAGVELPNATDLSATTLRYLAVGQ